jgi:hypothetical protein
MKVIQNYLSLIALLFFSFHTYSQYTDVINSNRPGTSRSAFSVGTNVLQFEVGPYLIDEKHELLNTETSGIGVDFSVRYGLFFEQLEVNIEGTYQSDKVTNNASAISVENKRSNFRTFAIGAKYLVYDPYKNAEEDKPNLYSWKANHTFKWKSLIPAVSVYAGVNFDSENNPFVTSTVSGISPKIMIASQNNLAGGWVFVINLIKDRIGTDQSDFQYIVTLTHSFHPKWAIFGETQGIKSEFYSDNLFRFGGAYLLSEKFQLDTAITLNTKDTPTVFNATLGASYRFDFHKDKEDNGVSAEEESERKENRKKGKKKKKNKKDKKKKAKKSERQDNDFDDDGRL